MTTNRAAKVAAARQRQAAAERRKRVGLVTAGVSVVALLGIAGVIAVGNSDAGGSDTVSAAPVTDANPAGLVDGALVAGRANAPVTVTLYEDLQCPACRAFHQLAGPTINEMVANGQIRLMRRPLAFLDRASADDYSTRALNAMACVQDSTPAAVMPYFDVLFDSQPEEGGAGLPDANLISLASKAGSGDITACVNELRFKGWTQRQTESAHAAGVSSTPTILIDGKPLADRSLEGFRAAVKAAAAS